ncbi:class B sortase [uncultured Eubacterium sp.]|uniref:class B sortase n=1 Tax=Eubacterium ventriosum TaxID=39496 RepID=UPI003266A703
MKRMIKISLILLLLGMAVIAAVPFLKEKEAERKSENGFKEIQESVTEKKDKTMNVTKLKGENKDCIGYLEVPGTSISYPIMQTRDNPNYYLNHDFDKNYSFYGTPYLSAYCDLKKSDNLIIYGHNINGGKMFGALEQYKEKDFFDRHRKIYFTTDRRREYEVFAVMSVNVRKFKYWKFIMARDEKDYDEFVQKVLEHSMWNIGGKPKYKEQILMLSTCDNGKEDDWRIVVVGKEI